MFLTLPFLLRFAAEPIIRCWERVGRRTCHDPLPMRRPTGQGGDLRVHRVDDPDGSSRIVRIVGRMTPSTLPRVFDTWSDVASPYLLHIDVADAVIADLTTMMVFEQAIDHLERQQIRIRIVGLDPSHPALIG